mgnify:CR=1 FL=1
MSPQDAGQPMVTPSSTVLLPQPLVPAPKPPPTSKKACKGHKKRKPIDIVGKELGASLKELFKAQDNALLYVLQLETATFESLVDCWWQCVTRRSNSQLLEQVLVKMDKLMMDAAPSVQRFIVAHLEDLLRHLSELQAARSEETIPSLATCALKLNSLAFFRQTVGFEANSRLIPSSIDTFEPHSGGEIT